MIVELLFLFIFVSIFPFILRRKGKLFLFRPDIIFSLAFLLYVVPVPLNKLYFGDFYGFDNAILEEMMKMFLLFVSGFYIGFHVLTSKSCLSPPKPEFNIISNKSISKWVLLVSMLFSVVLYLIYLSKLGGISAYLSADRMDIYKNNQGLGIYGVGILILKTVWVIILSKFMMNYYSEGSNNKITNIKLWIFILINILGFVGFAMFNLVIGDRRVLLGLILGLLGILYLYKYISNRTIIIFSLILLVFFQVFSKLRHLSNNPAEMVKFAQKEWTIEWLDLSNGESGGHYVVFNDILNNKHEINTLYGMSYIKSPLIIVPKFIYPNRYEGLSKWFVKKFYPGTAKKGGGFAFSIVAEAYMNFGFWGTLFVGFIFGVISAKIWFITMFKYKTALSYSIYMLLVLFIITMPRGDFSSLIKESFISIFLPIMVIFIVSKALNLKTGSSKSMEY